MAIGIHSSVDFATGYFLSLNTLDLSAAGCFILKMAPFICHT